MEATDPGIFPIVDKQFFFITFNFVICDQNESWLKIEEYHQADEGDVKSLSEDDVGDLSGDITLLKPHFEM